jgi:hypothetical protein
MNDIEYKTLSVEQVQVQKYWICDGAAAGRIKYYDIAGAIGLSRACLLKPKINGAKKSYFIFYTVSLYALL